ncbi:WYL domain-containing protein [Nitrogeniibacter mangrovi]|uniref:WYL domain-containing protein n=1 Tax=Nitrogeniibacter mangrovi TaxID=2016596 RepID=A0A6C1B7D7_9RHOO|nr:WYL domain-containing protein [Nitrogeniibacter mangrovi]QID19387.1 WYL domain-containing protein [Nitrogeniibacter mangrovi]
MSPHRDIQRERLFYIEFLALFAGQVSRKDIVSRFGISEPAATKDISLYADLAPGMLRYDLRQKCYVLAEGKPIFEHDVDQCLYSLAGERAIAMDTEHAKRLSSWVNCSIRRKMPLPLVATITRCMYQRRKMIAQYWSLSSGSKERMLSPLALVNDGLRWHIRCFDHERGEFRDYNLTRFQTVEPGDLSNVSLDGDEEWNTEVRLRLIPHPKADHPATIRLDYDIADDAKYVTLKACLVGYFLRHWHIDFTDGALGNPKAEQLFLDNKHELLKSGVRPWAFEA